MKNYAFKNCYILNGHKDMKVFKGSILLDGEKISKITEDSFNEEDYEVIDLDGKYVLPGLINMHVHLAGNGKPQKKQRDNEKLVKIIFATGLGRFVAQKLVEKYAKIELESGVTTIRTVGGLRDLDTRTRDKINAGIIDGPRILASNMAISVPGGHMAGSVAKACANADEAVDFIKGLKQENVDLIKLMITGGVMDAKEKGVPGLMKMSPEMIKKCCDEAHRLGYIVSAHVESSKGVKIALENGVDSIEHGALLDDETIELFKKNKAFLVCTISPGVPYALFDRSVSNASEVEQYNGKLVLDGFVEGTKKALANNIPVALGNDVGCPWISQYDFWRELVYFKKYLNVTNEFAIYSATLNNANLAGIGDITGSIDEGKCADLIVLDKNPLDDLNVLRSVKMVVARGKLHKDLKIKRNKVLDLQLDPFMN